MIIKAYLSNLVPGWSIQQQKDLLAMRLPGWKDIPTYVDVLPPAKRRAHAAASLIQRAELLRDTMRPENAELFVVVSLACLAWEQMDFLECVAAASKRGATILALDTERRITPNVSPSEIAEAVKEFVRRRAKAGLGPPGYLISAERRTIRSQDAAERIRDRWVLPTKDYPTDVLLTEAGICRNTANLYLRNRPEAQRRHRNTLAQAERNRKRERIVHARPVMRERVTSHDYQDQS